MNERILVIGATGMLGEPAARRLKEDGYQVRVLVRNVERAKELFDESYEVIQGDVVDMEALEQAMLDCTGVHISVSGPQDRLGAENVGALAPKLDVKQVTYLSGSTVAEQNRWFPTTAQKLEAEKAVRGCGVPYTILCPTWPMEQLPRFVINGHAMVVGVLPDPWHWFAADDLARMISNAFQREEAKEKRLYIHGPEGIPVEEALWRYCQAFHPEIDSVSVMTIQDARAVAESTGNSFLRNFAILMDYFKKVGEPGDPGQANSILGAPSITLDDWLEQRKQRTAT